VGGRILAVGAQRRRGPDPGDFVEAGEAAFDARPQGRREILGEVGALSADRALPTGARRGGRGVLQLQELLHDRSDARADLAVQAAAHVLALLDEVLQVELGKAPPAQQVRLRLGPSVRSCSYSSLDLALA
jgi:hypothetical protein